MPKKERPLTYVVTGKIRLSYCHLFVPSRMDENSKEKYSASIIIDKDDDFTLNKVNVAIEAALEQGKTSKFGGKIPKTFKNPLRDGDEREDDEAYEGKFFLNANSDKQPGVVDENVQKVLNPEEVYSGCYARVAISFYPYNYNGTKGIAVGLQNVQKLEDGERLSGGGNSAEEDFGSEDDMF